MRREDIEATDILFFEIPTKKRFLLVKQFYSKINSKVFFSILLPLGQGGQGGGS